MFQRPPPGLGQLTATGSAFMSSVASVCAAFQTYGNGYQPAFVFTSSRVSINRSLPPSASSGYANTLTRIVPFGNANTPVGLYVAACPAGIHTKRRLVA